MTSILAIETATDACSVALYRDGCYEELFELIPQQHSQRLFPMLRELLPSGDLRNQGIDAIAYGSGPGSFTGLRIAASAVQGLAFANQLPVVGVSTLACQVGTALREGTLARPATALSLLDARIGEVYWAVLDCTDELPRFLRGPEVSPAGELPVPETAEDWFVLGNGLAADGVELGALKCLPSGADLLPHARDLVPFALAELAAGRSLGAPQAQPDYVRNRVSWKKLSEQGKPA